MLEWLINPIKKGMVLTETTERIKMNPRSTSESFWNSIDVKLKSVAPHCIAALSEPT